MYDIDNMELDLHLDKEGKDRYRLIVSEVPTNDVWGDEDTEFFHFETREKVEEAYLRAIFRYPDKVIWTCDLKTRQIQHGEEIYSFHFRKWTR